jgi:hypothetical protein
MCLFFDPHASNDQRRYASRHTYVSSQEGEIFFFFQEHHTFFGQPTSPATTLATTAWMLF